MWTFSGPDVSGEMNCLCYLIMDMVMFMSVDVRVVVIMVGLVSVRGLMLTGVAAQYFSSWKLHKRVAPYLCEWECFS